MISGGDFYKVMCAMVPLYFAMLVAYASVKWWKIFSAEQCSGINRFVAVFAVPVLSFHFISQNNPYQMDTKFILADTLSKAFVLSLLSIWCIFKGQLDWVITLFSVSTCPTLWYTLLLVLFEYRAATILIQTRFPGPTAAAITKFHIDNDVISLDGRDPLCTDSEVDDNGRIHVRIRRSTSSAPPSSSMGLTPRASNLSNAEIFSINTPHEFGFGHRPVSPRLSGYASSDAYSLQPTPRASNFNELDLIASMSPTTGKVFRQPSPAVKMVWESPVEGQGFRDDVGDKDLSFRDCSKIEVEEGISRNNEEQEMPHALVMLRLILIVVGRKLSRNPNTYSSVLGLLWSLISFKWNVGMPSILKYSIKIISDAGLGMAMFSLGLFMALQPRIIACGTKMATISMAIRFIVGPTVMSTASVAVGLRGAHLHAAIVQLFPRDCPVCICKRIRTTSRYTEHWVIFGMLVSLPVTLLYYILLGL
ncbi:UNVERIFIED_CONTAM: Auxin efflux carrier component 6 [Sesamum calycinum]|uniref:Auxin efflux carrier component n=1 Tax=Sesamum calycinum TaxID=2727403 RepID=A0AAW2QN12_9LAMI